MSNDKAPTRLVREALIRDLSSQLVALVGGKSFPGRMQVIGLRIHELAEHLHYYFRWNGDTAQEIEFVVFGNPVPKARPRVRLRNGGKARAYTPRRTTEWEKQVRKAAQEAMGDLPPVEGPVGVELRIWRGDRRKADADNLEKAISDACNEVVWLDDDQVVEMHRYKGLDQDNPRAEVRVWEVED